LVASPSTGALLKASPSTARDWRAAAWLKRELGPDFGDDRPEMAHREGVVSGCRAAGC
jgi:hypothetical protein